VEPAQFSFFHDDGTVQVVDEEIRIIQPTPFTQSTPSLLGRDILKHFRLIADPPNRLIILD
jgi:hypothetical protein